MTRRTVLRRVILAMATQARSHRVLHEWLRASRLRHVSVTSGACDLSLEMRGVSKLHQSGRGETVDPLPGDLASGGDIRGDLFDFRLVRGNFRVA
jgi:hypothetical protein